MHITCSNCKATLTIKDSAAGKRGKCPKCGLVMQIPSETNSADGSKSTPATERQKEYATSLGIEYPPDVTKGEISNLINQAVEQRDDERFEKLNALNDRESEAYQQMREEIFAEIDPRRKCEPSCSAWGI